MSKHHKKAKGDCCKEFKGRCKKGADFGPPGGALPPMPPLPFPPPPPPPGPAIDEKCPPKPKRGGCGPGGCGCG